QVHEKITTAMMRPSARMPAGSRSLCSFIMPSGWKVCRGEPIAGTHETQGDSSGSNNRSSTACHSAYHIVGSGNAVHAQRANLVKRRGESIAARSDVERAGP